MGIRAPEGGVSTPWKRSRNILVQDEWRLQTGALSPTHSRAGRAQSPGRVVRAQTAQGHYDISESPNSQVSGHGGHLSMDQLKLERSLTQLNVSNTSRFNRTTSLDDSAQLPTLWVQDRYFTRPKTQVFLFFLDNAHMVSIKGSNYCFQ